MSVEFKLVGDMTVRQFFYVASGALVSFLFLKAHIPFLMRWGGILFFGLGGVALAFVPVQERGLDVWFKSFFKAMFTPTQKIWKKSPGVPLFFLSDYAQSLKTDVLVLTPTKSRLKLYNYLEKARLSRSLDPFEKTENEFLQKLDFAVKLPESLAQEATKVKKLPKNLGEEKNSKEAPFSTEGRRIDRPLKNIKFYKEIVLPKDVFEKHSLQDEIEPALKASKDEKKKIKELRDTISLAKKELEEKTKKYPKTQTSVKTSAKGEVAVLDTTEDSDKKGEKLPETEKKSKPLKPPATEAKEIKKRTFGESKGEKVTIVEVGSAQKKHGDGGTQMEKAEQNIVSGTVLDEEGHTVEGSLLLIKDSKGNPERALKTNRLGKFSTTTPVENGRYTIETRYQNKKFDVVNFTAEGRPIKPITIKAKY